LLNRSLLNESFFVWKKRYTVLACYGVL